MKVGISITTAADKRLDGLAFVLGVNRSAIMATGLSLVEAGLTREQRAALAAYESACAARSRR